MLSVEDLIEEKIAVEADLARIAKEISARKLTFDQWFNHASKKHFEYLSCASKDMMKVIDDISCQDRYSTITVEQLVESINEYDEEYYDWNLKPEEMKKIIQKENFGSILVDW